MKRCCECGQMRPRAEFHRNRGRYSVSRCKPCKAAYTHKYHAANRNAALETQAAWRHGNRERLAEEARSRYAATRRWVVALKLTLSCVDCRWSPANEDEVRRLEFDHTDRSTKHQTGASSAFRYSWARERIEAEIALCDPRCADCHRKRTTKQMRKFA